jgi:hypothetical protein
LRAQQILTQKTNQLLTPENLQLHSEAAALLLIWAANSIKLYACFKRLKMDEVVADKNASFKIENLAGVAT